MPFVAPLPDLRRPLGTERYVTASDLTQVTSDGRTIVVRAGKRTDLASVPRPVRWLIPESGPHEAAAIVHDDGCDQLNAFDAGLTAAVNGHPVGLHWPDRDSVTVDRDFREGLRDLGMGVARRWLAWCGVRWGALGNRARRGGWLSTALPVLLVTLLALPTVPPTLLVVACLRLLDLVEPACRPAPLLDPATLARVGHTVGAATP